MPSASAPKRQKISVACQRCRTRKLRCDGGRPACMQCTIGQSNCEWPAGVNNGSTSTETYDDNNSVMTAQTSSLPPFALLQQQQQQQHDQQQPPGHVVMSTTSSHTTPPFTNAAAAGQQQISPSSHHQHATIHMPATLSDWQSSHDPLLHTPIEGANVNHHHVPDLGWMMNELGVAYNGSSIGGLGSHATESPTSSSATGANDLLTRSKEARAGLDALTREEIFARAFGILARVCKDDIVSIDGFGGTTMDALRKASRCLSSRFDGLENVQEQVISTDDVHEQLRFALADVGDVLQRPSPNGVVALVFLAWAMYGEGDLRACSRFARTAYMSLTYLNNEEDAAVLEFWVITDLLVELAMRNTSADLDHIAQQMREEVTFPPPDDDPHFDSGLLATSMRIQQSAYDLSRFVNEKGSGTATPALTTSKSGGSQIIKQIFKTAQEVYAEVGIELNVPSTSVNSITFDEIESRSSTIYEGMASTLKFNVNNFAKHDRRGQGTEFLALHIKYEALMCTVCQVRAFAAAADDQSEEVTATASALEELRTGASAARSLADDLVVAEALAPWTVAANPSLDRYIFIAALGVLILFKATNGRWTISAEETGTVHARKRLLSNVLRQNFSACLRALQLLSKITLCNSKS